MHRVAYRAMAARLAAALVLGATGLALAANAEDAKDGAPAAKAPTITPAETTTGPAGHIGQTTPGEATGETNPCFTGKGSIKEVLDACAAFIASGSTDKERIVAAHGNRALGLSATKDFEGAVKEMDAAIALAPKEPNLYFMRAAANRAKRDLDKADDRHRRGDQPQVRPRRLLHAARHDLRR